ncbi:MAG: cell division protein FtsW [Chloroflexi bacterium]|nr:cell division protein FtsW [Chloroflexota bacterium]
MVEGRHLPQKGTTDYVLLLIVAILLFIGLMMIFSATFTLGARPTYFLERQALWIFLGLIALVITARLDYQIWRQWAVPILAVTLLVLLGLLFLGRGSEGARRWITGKSGQPSEFCKLTVIMYVAAWLASKGTKIRQVTYGLVPFAILVGFVAALIILQPARSTAVLIAFVAGIMFFVAGADTVQVMASLVIGLATTYLVVRGSDYATSRVETFLNPMSDPLGEGYQIRGVLTALASGGLTGRGLGESVQKLFPPQVYHSDAIIAIIGEELGLIGCLVVIGLFLCFAYRGLYIALKAKDTFATLLAVGITSWITCQAFIHLAANTATLPYTGVTLPFVSYGGSSVVSCLAGVGVLLSVGRGTPLRKSNSASFNYRRRNRGPRLSGTVRRQGSRHRTQ